MTANRKTLNLARTIYIDPAGGSDANPGTLALPFQSWNGGAWPLIASLRHTVVNVQYTTTTPDPSVVGLYALPPGVRVTVSCPWVAQNGTRTAAALTNPIQVIDSVGGFTTNEWEGARIRWLDGPGAGKVFWTAGNNATTLQNVGGNQGGSPGVAGNHFVIERPQGGWLASAAAVPNADYQIDCSAVGSGLVFEGFLVTVDTGVFSTQAWMGDVQAAGLTLDTATLGGALLVNVQGRLSLGEISDGNIIPSFSSGALPGPVGTPATLGCYINGLLDSVTQISAWDTQQTVINLVVREGFQGVFGGGVSALNVFLRTDGSNSGVDIARADFLLTNITQSGAFGAQPVMLVDGGASGQVTIMAVDPALTNDVIVVDHGSAIIVAGLTGSNATPGKVGVRLSDGSELLNVGTNTAVGGAGAVSVDGVFYPSWTGITTLLSDIKQQGLYVFFAGSHTAAAGTITTFYGQGGTPVAGNTSTSAFHWPLPVGTNFRNLCGRILTNAATVTVTYTMLLAPKATGVNAPTTLTVAVTSGTTGNVQDTTHSFLAQSQDMIDLQSQSTNGTGAITSTWGVQAA